MKRALAACAAILALATWPTLARQPVPTGSPAAAGYAPIGRDEKGLWAEAEEAELQLKDSKLLIRDPAINAYLRQVLCRVTGAEACQSVRIYLLRVPEFNATMRANGTMEVYSGLLLRVRDEAELAAVLGHEFTHFQNRHSLSGLRRQRSMSSWAAWLTVASTFTREPRNYYPDFMAYYYSYNRDQEREADDGGIHLMSRAGYSPMAASTIWMRLRDEKDAQAAALGLRSLKDTDYGPFASHPMNIERMTTMAREGQALAAGATPGFEGLAEFRAAVAPLWPTLIDDQIKLNDFGASEYILTNLARGDWTGPLLFARGELYRARAKDGDLLTAETLYRQALVKPDAPPATWRGLGLILIRIGRKDEGRSALSEYLKLNPNAPDRGVLTAMANGN